MKKKLLSTFLLTLLGLSLFAQEQKGILDLSKKIGSATKSQMFTLQCLGEISTPTADLKWKPILARKYIALEPKVPNFEMIEEMKIEKLKQKKISNKKINQELSTQSVLPVMGTNFLGNINSGSSPMDNSIAVSNGGVIVSVANTTLEIDDISGNNLYYNDIPTFFNDPNIVNTCDPVVLYDKLTDKFIFFFQEWLPC